MIKRHKILSILITVTASFIVLSLVYGFSSGLTALPERFVRAWKVFYSGQEEAEILGEVREVPMPVATAMTVQTVAPTDVPPLPVYSVSYIGGPADVSEDEPVTFTWSVDGQSRTISTTTVYYGTESKPGTLSTSVTPAEAGYPDFLKDFMDGRYVIPLRFVGNIPGLTAGTYYYRIYALVGQAHYWSRELSFNVKPKPRHEIRVIDRPERVERGKNAAFTWEVTGPPATTGFTTVAIGNKSLPGILSDAVDTTQTPYTVLTKDFISGTFDIPLRFIGNAVLSEPGQYFFRAMAFINGKNIWSEEYSFYVD